jgi:hypothetical protein
MKIAGFTFIRNAIEYDFPVYEAITSILPLCDEVFVALGNSVDDTPGLIRSISPDKIRIIPSEWDKSSVKGGTVYADETNKAFDAIPAQYDWCIYIQGDEVVHEKDLQVIRDAMQRYLSATAVEGLLFRYRHFYGTFDYVADSRRWYRREVRIIRNNKEIRSYRDAQGFRKNGKKLQVMPVDAVIFHYGWVRHPRFMQAKIEEVRKYYDGQPSPEQLKEIRKLEFNYSQEYDSLIQFEGTHPSVMAERIRRLNWKVEVDPSVRRLRLKYRILYWFEKITGIRPFEFRTYRIIKA